MSKPLLYLLAGNGSSAEWWDDALPHFEHYQVTALELPGFGSNPQPPCEDEYLLNHPKASKQTLELLAEHGKTKALKAEAAKRASTKT